MGNYTWNLLFLTSLVDYELYLVQNLGLIKWDQVLSCLGVTKVEKLPIGNFSTLAPPPRRYLDFGRKRRLKFQFFFLEICAHLYVTPVDLGHFPSKIH